MAYLFTTATGRRNPHKVLTVDVYADRLDRGLLTPTTRAFGFKTFVSEVPSSPFLIDEEFYLAQFRLNWEHSVRETAAHLGVSYEDFLRVISSVDPTTDEIPAQLDLPNLLDKQLEIADPTPTGTGTGIATATTTATATDTSVDGSKDKSQTTGYKAADNDNDDPHAAGDEVRKVSADDGFPWDDSQVELYIDWLKFAGFWNEEDDDDLVDAAAIAAGAIAAGAMSPIAAGAMSPIEDGEIVEEAVPHLAGAQRRRERAKTLLKQLRVPPLQHIWTLWHDRPNRARKEEGNTSTSPVKAQPGDSLREIVEFSDIQKFWEVWNNLPLTMLEVRCSLYLFKKTVKPLWEDVRNVNGGCWTFRVSPDKTDDFWREINLMAVGGELQSAVEAHDDICGIGLSRRFSADLITIWNRAGDNQKSINQILEVVLEIMPAEWKPEPSSYYYKRHAEHRGFVALPGAPGLATVSETTEAGKGEAEDTTVKETVMEASAPVEETESEGAASTMTQS
ncbi:MAG: hypothetical protein M1826_004726 [Phylliscum demangeonii]|nr:MAG: hypothetical protein M1826_004726 [Phylliscum demangeonii]